MRWRGCVYLRLVKRKTRAQMCGALHADLLLQELNALILLDQKALEDADVQIALQVAKEP